MCFVEQSKKYDLDGCVETCNTLIDLSNKVCISNKTKDLKLSVFNMITGGLNESKKITKPVWFNFKCKFDITKCKPNQWWNNDKCQCECRKTHICETDYAWDSAACNCENGKYLASIMYDSKIVCDKVLDVKETNFNQKKVTC